MKQLMLTTLAFGTLACTNGLSEIGSRTDAHKERPPERVLCRVTGGGQIYAGEEPDSFGGNAQTIPNGGHWNHLTHEGLHLNGRPDPDSIRCFDVEGDEADPPAAPANAIVFSGVARVGGTSGCEFSVYIEDHGEAGTEDFYSIEFSCPGGLTYAAGDTLLHGNLQIHAIPPGHTDR